MIRVFVDKRALRLNEAAGCDKHPVVLLRQGDVLHRTKELVIQSEDGVVVGTVRCCPADPARGGPYTANVFLELTDRCILSFSDDARPVDAEDRTALPY